MASISSRRLAKELKELATAGTPVGMSSSLIRGISTEIIVLTGIKLLKADDFETWILSLQVMGESLYKVWNKPTIIPLTFTCRILC